MDKLHVWGSKVRSFADDATMHIQDMSRSFANILSQLGIDVWRQLMFIEDANPAIVDENVHGKIAPDERLRGQGHLVGDVEVVGGISRLPPPYI